MAESPEKNGRSLTLLPDVSLEGAAGGPKRILFSLVAGALAIALRDPQTVAAAEEFFERGNECYYSGKGTPEDQREAVSWFLKAARIGHAHAQYSLGQCYDEALGVEKNSVQAIKWWKIAAEQGHEMAQYELGWKYRYGIDLPVDCAEAYRWFRMAANAGNREAESQVEALLSILERKS